MQMGCFIRHQAFWTDLKSAFPGEVKFNEPLKGYTSFGIGGMADCMVTVTTMEKLIKLIALVNDYQPSASEHKISDTGHRTPVTDHRISTGDDRTPVSDYKTFASDDRTPGSGHRMPFFVLGKGTNLLVKDGGIRGLVVRLGEEFGRATVQEDQIIAGAACPLSSLLRLSVQHSLSGLEFATGIPGLLGGAVYMNAGSAKEGIGYLVREVQLVYPDGSTELLAAAAGTPSGPGGLVEDCEPGGCRILSPSSCLPVQISGATGSLEFAYRRCFLPQGGIITRASVQLRQAERKESVLAQIRERYRYRAAHQPLREKSAGCIFKNPPGESAGRLIEQAGLKGISIGGAQISTIHANFINNRDNASCSDVLHLMDMIQKKVYHSFGIALEAEVQIVGE